MTSSARPFDTIESAHDFLVLLGEAIGEAIDEAGREVSTSAARQNPERLNAWRLALYKMETLSSDVAHSRKLMTELQTLRDSLHCTGDRAHADAVRAGAGGAVRWRNAPLLHDSSWEAR